MSESRPDAPSDLTDNSAPKASAGKIFISYSHKDTKFLNELLVHLKPHERAGLVSKWSDKQIEPGSQWFAEIQRALGSTKVAVLMVSPNFLASDFIHEHEFGPLLKKAEQGGVQILWIPVRACSYSETPLKDYQAVINPAKPLAQMKTADRDNAWVSVYEKIKKALTASPAHGSPPPRHAASPIALKDAIARYKAGIIAEWESHWIETETHQDFHDASPDQK